VLQTIADGLSLVLQRPYLMLLPLLLDLVLWLVVQVSVQPLADRIATFLVESGAEDGAVAAERVSRLGAQVRASDAVGAFLPSIFSGLPLDTLFHGFVLFLGPQIALGIDRDTMYDTWEKGLFGVWTPSSPAVVAGITFVLLMVGSLLLVAFRVPLARAVRKDTSPLSHAVRETGVAWIRFLGYLALLALAGAALLIPVGFASVVFIILGFDLIFVLTMALLIFGGMASVYTLFVLDAMLLHRIGPLQGIRMSMMVARSYFGQTTRFAATSLLLATGALQVWSVIIENAPGIFIALIANAFLGTGLSLASMLFYADRFRRIKASRQRLHS